MQIAANRSKKIPFAGKKVDPSVSRAVGNFVSETLGDRRFESRPVQQPPLPPSTRVSSFVDHRIFSSLRHALTNFSYEKSILPTNTFSPTEFASFSFFFSSSSLFFPFFLPFRVQRLSDHEVGHGFEKCQEMQAPSRSGSQSKGEAEETNEKGKRRKAAEARIDRKGGKGERERTEESHQTWQRRKCRMHADIKHTYMQDATSSIQPSLLGVL